MALLTAAALAVIGFFTYQAQAAVDRAAERDAKRPAPSSAPGPRSSLSPEERERALPRRSGNGERVVYALERRRVWIVGKGGKVARTYPVWPSSVDPEPGTYRVTSRSAQVTGSDGVPVENVVVFTVRDGVVIGFSAATDGSRPKEGGAGKRSGGIREARADGEALWLFATIGKKVVVVR